MPDGGADLVERLAARVRARDEGSTQGVRRHRLVDVRSLRDALQDVVGAETGEPRRFPCRALTEEEWPNVSRRQVSPQGTSSRRVQGNAVGTTLARDDERGRGTGE